MHFFVYLLIFSTPLEKNCIFKIISVFLQTELISFEKKNQLLCIFLQYAFFKLAWKKISESDNIEWFFPMKYYADFILFF